jgi:hypothetical protein
MLSRNVGNQTSLKNEDHTSQHISVTRSHQLIRWPKWSLVSLPRHLRTECSAYICSHLPSDTSNATNSYESATQHRLQKACPKIPKLLPDFFTPAASWSLASSISVPCPVTSNTVLVSNQHLHSDQQDRWWTYHITQRHGRYHCCPRKAINVTYFWVCVRKPGRAMLRRHSWPFLIPQHFLTLSHKRHDFRKKKNYWT